MLNLKINHIFSPTQIDAIQRNCPTLYAQYPHVALFELKKSIKVKSGKPRWKLISAISSIYLTLFVLFVFGIHVQILSLVGTCLLFLMFIYFSGKLLVAFLQARKINLNRLIQVEMTFSKIGKVPECWACQYDFINIQSDTCPECGTSASAKLLEQQILQARKMQPHPNIKGQGRQ